MKPLFAAILSLLCFSSFMQNSDFLEQQKKFERVRKAISDKKSTIEKKLKSKNLLPSNFNLLLVAYKANDKLDLYVKSKAESKYTKLETYKICARSGELGPKRKQGDNQVPEGFYHIDRFNPNSNFYLSLGLNYPNASDKRKSNASNMGGDIFIHGSCVTIGCLPMTDDLIKEIYLYAVYARNNGQQKIPVYLFPFEMNDENLQKQRSSPHYEFWKNLKVGYDQFIQSEKELKFEVSPSGNYTF